jgi:hypothetical protein
MADAPGRSALPAADKDEVTGPADPANPDPNTGLAADEGGALSTPENSSLIGGETAESGYKMDPGGAGNMGGGSRNEQDRTGSNSGPGRFGTG